MNQQNNNWNTQVPKRSQQKSHSKKQKKEANNDLTPPSSVPNNSQRHFYQKWWFWVILGLLLVIVGILVFWFWHQQSASENLQPKELQKTSAVSKTKRTPAKKEKANSQSQMAKSSSATAATSTAKTPQSTKPQKGNTAIGKTGSALEVFNSIKLGDTSNNGTGGDLESDLKKKLNAPHKIEELVYQGKSAHRDTWGEVIGISKGSGNVVIFVKDGTNYRAVSKTSVGISNDVKKEKFTLQQFNQLKTQGLTTEKAIKILGQPNAMTESHLAGQVYISYTWDTNLQGSNDAQVTINFTNNQATNKNQDGLK